MTQYYNHHYLIWFWVVLALFYKTIIGVDSDVEKECISNDDKTLPYYNKLDRLLLVFFMYNWTKDLFMVGFYAFTKRNFLTEVIFGWYLVNGLIEEAFPIATLFDDLESSSGPLRKKWLRVLGILSLCVYVTFKFCIPDSFVNLYEFLVHPNSISIVYAHNLIWAVLIVKNIVLKRRDGFEPKIAAVTALRHCYSITYTGVIINYELGVLDKIMHLLLLILIHAIIIWFNTQQQKYGSRFFLPLSCRKYKNGSKNFVLSKFKMNEVESDTVTDWDYCTNSLTEECLIIVEPAETDHYKMYSNDLKYFWKQNCEHCFHYKCMHQIISQSEIKQNATSS